MGMLLCGLVAFGTLLIGTARERIVIGEDLSRCYATTVVLPCERLVYRTGGLNAAFSVLCGALLLIAAAWLLWDLWTKAEPLPITDDFLKLLNDSFGHRWRDPRTWPWTRMMWAYGFTDRGRHTDVGCRRPAVDAGVILAALESARSERRDLAAVQSRPIAHGMRDLEGIVGLLLAAVLLAAAARRVGAPYPVFLAIGGALLAFVPGAPSITIPPELALALFVAPILLDAAYDASPRDLKDNWAPLAGLVVFAVGLTTAAVAVVAHALVPAMPWAAAIALGAIVAPPDAAAATAVLRPLRPPHRLLTILEGESLLNDASALLIYRLARRRGRGAAASPSARSRRRSSSAWPAAWSSARRWPGCSCASIDRVRHVPTAIILQFVSTFGVWILADSIGLSGVLTMVCYAMTVARTAPERTPARIRIPSYAVWETVVFVLNILAFIFIGLQIRPILDGLEPAMRGRYFDVAGAVLVTVIVVRIAWHMSFNAVIRWRDRRTASTRRGRCCARPSAAAS